MVVFSNKNALRFRHLFPLPLTKYNVSLFLVAAFEAPSAPPQTPRRQSLFFVSLPTGISEATWFVAVLKYSNASHPSSNSACRIFCLHCFSFLRYVRFDRAYIRLSLLHHFTASRSASKSPSCRSFFFSFCRLWFLTLPGVGHTVYSTVGDTYDS